MNIDSHEDYDERRFVPKGMRASQGTGIGGGNRKASVAYVIYCRFGCILGDRDWLLAKARRDPWFHC